MSSRSRKPGRPFGLIGKRWVDSSLLLKDDTYLKRRNFTRTSWKAGHPSDVATPAWVTAPITVTATYDFTCRKGFTRAQFAAKIAAIRAKAALLYPKYDQPT